MRLPWVEHGALRFIHVISNLTGTLQFSHFTEEKDEVGKTRYLALGVGA